MDQYPGLAETTCSTAIWANSLTNSAQPVADRILEVLPNTILLMGTSLVLSFLISIPLGLIAGLKKNQWHRPGHQLFLLYRHLHPLLLVRPDPHHRVLPGAEGAAQQRHPHHRGDRPAGPGEAPHHAQPGAERGQRGHLHPLHPLHPPSPSWRRSMCSLPRPRACPSGAFSSATC